MESVELEVAYKSLKVKYVGSEGFLREGFIEMCQKLASLDVAEEPQAIMFEQEEAKHIPNVASRSKKSTTDFAVAMDAGSGPDLAMAACANLCFTGGKEEMKRSEILDAMKSAKGFYKTTYSGNLSSILNGLVKKGKLTNPGNEVYAISHSEMEAMKSHAH
jgi:hypothetical protein